MKAVALCLLACLIAGVAQARETITLWFWGAPPVFRQALQDALVTPFNQSQDKYALVIEYRTSVDSDVRIAAIANRGPDIIYTSGPTDVIPLARAGKLAPMDAYAERFGWNDRLLGPVLNTCREFGHLYCVPPSLCVNGMFYNKAVLKANDWPVPKTRDEVEAIMKAAQAKGLYASATGNKGWQPVNEDYASIFVNQVVGPKKLYGLLTGSVSWTSPEMVAAVTELDRWFKSGYLGGHDYFSLNFDGALALLHQKRTPFFFGPSFSYQWAMNYFKGEEADELGFAAFPQMDPNLPYPIYDIGSAFTFSINANSQVKDGAAEVLDMILSSKFVLAISKVWPGYWSVPLREFPREETAEGIFKSYFESMADISAAVKDGRFGFNMVSFFPPATKEVFIEDVEAQWFDEETADQLLRKAGTAFARERSRGLTQAIPEPQF